MEGYSRDLLRGIDGARREQRPRVDLKEEETEGDVELSLGLSLGGRFGPEKLARSSSVACILTPVEAAPPSLFRTSSLPVKAAPEAVKEQSFGDVSCFRGNGVEVEPAARLPGSGSSSSGSSDNERLEVNMTNALARTCSLPAGIENEWRKRKEAQSLKRLEVKRKRIERRNSLNFNVSKEAVGQILEQMSSRTGEVGSCDNVAIGNKQIGGNVNHSNEKHHPSGLPPTHQATLTSQHRTLSGMLIRHNSVAKGIPRVEERALSSAVPSSTEGTIIAALSPSALSVRAAALGSRGEQKYTPGRVAARARSMGDVEHIMMQEMPCVCTKGLPNGKKVEGFLYKYKKGEEVRIVCVCHGRFWTPAEFVKHAGGGDVANPLRHIVVNPVPSSLF